MTLTTYNRRTRRWDVVTLDGDRSFNKPWQAQDYAVQVNFPTLYRLVQSVIKQHPVLKNRARKAAVLAAEGKVHFFARSAQSLVATVDGSQPGVQYEVHDRDCNTSCTCPDFQGQRAPIVSHGGRVVRMCKHILAYRFVMTLPPAVRFSGRVTDQFGQPPVEGHNDVRRYANGEFVSQSLITTHAQFMTKHDRVARDEKELHDWIYRN